jgi:hypothetical protein
LRRLAFVASFVVLAACQPVFVLPGGGGAAPCPQGTYNVTSQVLSSVLPSRLGNLQLSPTAGGTLTLTVTATTWKLAGTQGFNVAGASPFGVLAGVATVTVDASGAWTKLSATTLSFNVAHVTGTGNYQGTVSGVQVNVSASLADIGLDHVYGFTGKADFACGTAPNLTLTFTSLRLKLDRH